jgi:hypothetical protein
MQAANGDVIRQVLHQTTAEFEKAYRRYGSPPYAAVCRFRLISENHLEEADERSSLKP